MNQINLQTASSQSSLLLSDDQILRSSQIIQNYWRFLPYHTKQSLPQNKDQEISNFLINDELERFGSTGPFKIIIGEIILIESQSCPKQDSCNQIKKLKKIWKVLVQRIQRCFMKQKYESLNQYANILKVVINRALMIDSGQYKKINQWANYNINFPQLRWNEDSRQKQFIQGLCHQMDYQRDKQANLFQIRDLNFGFKLYYQECPDKQRLRSNLKFYFKNLLFPQFKKAFELHKENLNQAERKIQKGLFSLPSGLASHYYDQYQKIRTQLYERMEKWLIESSKDVELKNFQQYLQWASKNPTVDKLFHTGIVKKFSKIINNIFVEVQLTKSLKSKQSKFMNLFKNLVNIGALEKDISKEIQLNKKCKICFSTLENCLKDKMVIIRQHFRDRMCLNPTKRKIFDNTIDSIFQNFKAIIKLDRSIITKEIFNKMLNLFNTFFGDILNNYNQGVKAVEKYIQQVRFREIMNSTIQKRINSIQLYEEQIKNIQAKVRDFNLLFCTLELKIEQTEINKYQEILHQFFRPVRQISPQFRQCKQDLLSIACKLQKIKSIPHNPSNPSQFFQFVNIINSISKEMLMLQNKSAVQFMQSYIPVGVTSYALASLKKLKGLIGTKIQSLQLKSEEPYQNIVEATHIDAKTFVSCLRRIQDHFYLQTKGDLKRFADLLQNSFDRSKQIRDSVKDQVSKIRQMLSTQFQIEKKQIHSRYRIEINDLKQKLRRSRRQNNDYSSEAEGDEEDESDDDDDDSQDDNSSNVSHVNTSVKDDDTQQRQGMQNESEYFGDNSQSSSSKQTEESTASQSQPRLTETISTADSVSNDNSPSIIEQFNLQQQQQSDMVLKKQNSVQFQTNEKSELQQQHPSVLKTYNIQDERFKYIGDFNIIKIYLLALAVIMNILKSKELKFIGKIYKSKLDTQGQNLEIQEQSGFLNYSIYKKDAFTDEHTQILKIWSLKRVPALIYSLARGIAELEEIGIFHSDIFFRNTILIKRARYCFKIIDFDLSFSVDTDSMTQELFSEYLTNAQECPVVIR